MNLINNQEQKYMEPNSSGRYVGRSYLWISFCQPLWALTKRRDDIVVADTVAIMESNMVADMEVDNVATVNKEVATITISLP